MKKILGISLLALLIIGLATILFIVLTNSVQTKHLPKDAPIINGKIISSTAYRSDDLQRGVKIEIETNLSLKEAVQFYSAEFTKRGIIPVSNPTFQGDSRDMESSTEATAIGETKNHQQMVVNIRSEQQITRVTIEVKGNSVFLLPE